MNGIVLSVIVPVYNTAPWLRRCLDSICAQTYRNLEILCVNDGSTDNSAEILAEYAARDARIRVFTQANAGLSAARNTALAHATGEWVAGVDSDDYLAPDLFEHAVSRIADEVDMVAYGMLERWEGAPEKDAVFEAYAADEVQPMTVELAGHMLVCFCNKLWRHRLIKEHGLRFPHGLLHEDDGFFYQFIPYVRKVVLCSAVGYYYMQRRGSIMNSGQSLLLTAERYAEVVRYVHAEYAKRGMVPVQSPWFRLMVSRIYRDRCHHTPEKDREALGKVFYSLLQELRLLPALVGDYRFRCMIPVRGWRRLFLSRYLNTEIYRFFGIPVWYVEYREGRVSVSNCTLLAWIKWKLTGK